MHKQISIKKQNLYQHISVGVLLLISGLLFCIPNDTAKIISSIIAMIGCFSMAFTTFSNRERTDEMTRQYMGKSYRIGFYFTIIALMIMQIINILSEYFLKLTLIEFGSFGQIAAGIGFLSVGMKFAKLDGGIFDAKTED